MKNENVGVRGIYTQILRFGKKWRDESTSELHPDWRAYAVGILDEMASVQERESSSHPSRATETPPQALASLATMGQFFATMYLAETIRDGKTGDGEEGS